MSREPIFFLLLGAFCALLLLMPILILLYRRIRETGHTDSADEGVRRLEELAQKMDELSKIFIVPRTRGGVGETMLEELLSNWLPRSAWRRQYRFSDGGMVDAVIRAGSFLVPVDAKFPLEQLSEVLKKRDSGNGSSLSASQRKIFISYARELSEKYIRPEEGTLQFALLYIPSEHLYYRCFVEDAELSGQLLDYHVAAVSPSSLFLYLQTIAFGLRGLELPSRARELKSLITRLNNELRKLERQFATGAHHLKNLQGSFEEARGQLLKVSSVGERLDDGAEPTDPTNPAHR